MSELSKKLCELANIEPNYYSISEDYWGNKIITRHKNKETAFRRRNYYNFRLRRMVKPELRKSHTNFGHLENFVMLLEIMFRFKALEDLNLMNIATYKKSVIYKAIEIASWHEVFNLYLREQKWSL